MRLPEPFVAMRTFEILIEREGIFEMKCSPGIPSFYIPTEFCQMNAGDIYIGLRRFLTGMVWITTITPITIDRYANIRVNLPCTLRGMMRVASKTMNEFEGVWHLEPEE